MSSEIREIASAILFGVSKSLIYNSPKSDFSFEIVLASSKEKLFNNSNLIVLEEFNLSKTYPVLSTTEIFLMDSLFTLVSQPINKIIPAINNGVKSVDKINVLFVILFKYSRDVISLKFPIFNYFQQS